MWGHGYEKIFIFLEFAIVPLGLFGPPLVQIAESTVRMLRRGGRTLQPCRW